MMTNSQGLYTAIAIIAVSFLAFLIFIKITMFISDFREELQYINMEIRRCDGEERRYWERAKRKLWLSLIPFFKR